MKQSYLGILFLCVSMGPIFVSGGCFAQDAVPGLVERGKYLAIAADCNACHHDPISGEAFSGGYGVKTPLGDIIASNITPSKISGIGNWSLHRFSDAVRKGRVGAHFLYPAMPYPEYSAITDEDIRALYSYFQLGILPVENVPRQTQLNFPFNIRFLMAGWNLFFGGGAPYAIKKASGVDRGKYLATALGHCSACHTPRNIFMGTNKTAYLSGGKVGAWTAPNITSDTEEGIGRWSEADIISYLKTGVAHGKAIAAGDMGVAVQNSFSKMNDGDIRDIARYIKSLAPIRSNVSSTENPSAFTNINEEKNVRLLKYQEMINISDMSGKDLYEGACSSCHGHDGLGGMGGNIPPLKGVSVTSTVDPSDLVLTISEGVNRSVSGHHIFMPAFGNNSTFFNPEFNAVIIAKIADYVSSSFGVPSHHINLLQVKEILSCDKGNPQNGRLKYISILSIISLLLIVFIAVIVFIRKHVSEKK